MFQLLSKDIIQEIFEYDRTYRDEFVSTLELLVTPHMKALQHCLNYKNFIPGINEEREFETMRELDVDVGLDHRFIEIKFSQHKKMAFYVLPVDERDDYDFPPDSSSRLVIKEYLAKLPISTISFVTEIPEGEILEMLEEYDNINDKNNMLYDLLGAKRYSKLVYHLMDIGIYNNILHRYFFERFFEKIDDIYFLEDADNYCYFRYNRQDYVVYWNLYTSTEFM